MAKESVFLNELPLPEMPTARATVHEVLDSGLWGSGFPRPESDRAIPVLSWSIPCFIVWRICQETPMAPGFLRYLQGVERPEFDSFPVFFPVSAERGL